MPQLQVYRTGGMYEVRRPDGSRVAVFYSLADATAFIAASA